MLSMRQGQKPDIEQDKGALRNRVVRILKQSRGKYLYRFRRNGLPSAFLWRAQSALSRNIRRFVSHQSGDKITISLAGQGACRRRPRIQAADTAKYDALNEVPFKGCVWGFDAKLRFSEKHISNQDLWDNPSSYPARNKAVCRVG